MCSFFNIESIILSSKWTVAYSVEKFFLKPNWEGFKILFTVKYEIKRLYVIFSNALEIDGNKEIGR